MLYLHVFLNKQRLLMFINYNLYQNIFQMTLKVLPCSWFYHAVNASCWYCVFTLTIFPENLLFKDIFENRAYYLIEHTFKYLFMPKMSQMSLRFYIVGQVYTVENKRNNQGLF